jgi:hypothetical protein
MKIEIGQKYVTRDGDTAMVVGVVEHDTYPVKVSGPYRNYTCTMLGSVLGAGAPHPGDLVAEWEPYPHERIKALEEKLACSERARQKWEDTAASVANVRDYYSRIIKEVADAIGPAAYTSDDGSVQPIPLRARLACRVQDLQSTILEQERQLQRYKALLPSAPPALEMQVGGAYLTRGGDVAIIVSSDDHEHSPFDVESENGSEWCVTRSGTEFRNGECEDDLVTRIRFPEPAVAAPEGFVCVGNKLLPEYHDAADIKVCSWGDNGNNEYCVRVGSPVHFAFATKFRNEA